MKFKFYRRAGASADFATWGLGDTRLEVDNLIKRLLSRSLDVVFSEKGVNCRFYMSFHGKNNNLMLNCDVEIAEYDVYATTSVALREMIIEADIHDKDKKVSPATKIAASLRDMANVLDPQ